MLNKRPILLVEDDWVDAMTVRRALKEISVTNPLNVVYNGEQAITFLQENQNEKPFIILLDLNMPRLNGIEFLKELKQNDEFKRIPVIVLTTSTEEQDKVDSYDFGASGYIRKPLDYKKFVETLRTVLAYWSLNEFPLI